MDDLRLTQLKAREAQLKTALWQKEAQHRDLLAAKAKADEERKRALREAENYNADYSRGEGVFERFVAGDQELRDIILSSIANLFPSVEHERDHPNYSLLPLELRVATLGPFLGIKPEREAFPRLVLGNSDLVKGRYVFRHFAGPADIDLWRRHLPKIKTYLAPQFEWIVEPVDATHVALSCHHPLPAAIPVESSDYVDGQVYFGLDPQTRERFYQPIADLTHVLVAGASGAGKSNALHVLIASFLHNIDMCQAVYLIDGKDGVAFNRYRHAGPKVHVLWELDEVAAVVAKLVPQMKAANEAQRDAGIDNATSGFTVIIIDELSTFAAPVTSDLTEKKLHTQLIDHLAAIARRGRSVGLRIIVTVQEPNKESIPVSLRGNINTDLVFCLPIQQHVGAIFGEIAGLPADPRKLTRGQAIFRNRLSGTQCLVQFPVLARPAAPSRPETA